MIKWKRKATIGFSSINQISSLGRSTSIHLLKTNNWFANDIDFQMIVQLYSCSTQKSQVHFRLNSNTSLRTTFTLPPHNSCLSFGTTFPTTNMKWFAHGSQCLPKSLFTTGPLSRY